MYISTACTAQKDTVSLVYWFHPSSGEYITLVNGIFPDGQMYNWGWKDKTRTGFGYIKPAKGRIALNCWQNPATKAIISVYEDEYTNTQMMKWGFRNKRVECYVPLENRQHIGPRK